MMSLMICSRTVTGFLARQTQHSSCRPKRCLHYYNSQWIQRRPSQKSIIATRAAEQEEEEEDSGSTTETEDPFSEYRNKNNINDQVVSGISGQGGIKVTVCTIRNMINDLMIQHTMTEVPIQAMGRTLTCSLLIANGMQKEQTVQITLNSNGPLRGLVAIASGGGKCRGFVGSPMLGDMSIFEAVGKGVLQVVKNHPEWPRPYNGITAIQHGDIDRDVGIYLAESEQRSCALAAATAVKGILCVAAGGYLIEQLPGVTDEEVAQIEKNLAKLVEMDGGDQLPTNLLLSGTTPVDIMEIILDGLDAQPLQQLTPNLECDCTEDRLLRAIRLLPASEVDDLLEKEEQLEARCEFCGKVYRMESWEVKEKLEQADGDPSLDSEFEDKGKK
ncbi:33 kDa chaperonin [Seminavis robusta]|uniref:33 kDa chaperonin n=1 Tax=Seminavis robusta TaxID=568900 RepID=A0A9N8HLU2_9STRA|nr:33 kDa chaperonin [Seminavis robusta]|eukprot:Sro944_g222940.1 33 kDa chaperonin (387) ;mRNA; r:17998-19469